MRERVRNRVRDFRVKRGVTQQELAFDVGVTRQTVVAIERGNYTPSVLLALKLARYFQVRVEEIFSYGT